MPLRLDLWMIALRVRSILSLSLSKILSNIVLGNPLYQPVRIEASRSETTRQEAMGIPTILIE
jgi:hypothetical protein